MEGFYQLLVYYWLGVGIVGWVVYEVLVGVKWVVVFVFWGGGYWCVGDDDQWLVQFMFIQQ